MAAWEGRLRFLRSLPGRQGVLQREFVMILKGGTLCKYEMGVHVLRVDFKRPVDQGDRGVVNLPFHEHSADLEIRL